ncbi:MAG TPA: glycosyltransferase family 2 protein [Candidatus Wunengus sp. YC60]|uniref:glycosyltransferase family 2 protein n=1 Tax=Candidatus Wunengus sp. YC60 TaxID=3367697 RepID=UPI004027D57F
MSENKILVAIPVFNEADARNIIQRVNNFHQDVLVVDDGSTNGLHKELINLGNIHVITHPRNLGYGKTIIDAFTFAIENGYDYLLTIDSDGQHEPEEILLFLKEIPFYDCDILSGSRYYFSTKIKNEFPQERYLINKEIAGIINSITGFDVTDAFCGFKAYKVEKLQLMHLTEHGYGMPLQLWIQAWKSGLRVREVPVKLIYKDLSKQFKGVLKNPVKRLNYYKNIIEKEVADTLQKDISVLKTKKKAIL